ncbi:MAG: hypothetical protein EXR62_00235 [Chloroflexi bacterium]|nr:hypothetical protein [Chloroflexota bacterium]
MKSSEDDAGPKPRLALVGVCGSGKSTVGALLHFMGYDVREPVQEHSGIPDMWQLMSKPDVLIYLDADWSTVNQRRDVDWEPTYIEEQRRRLAHARAHANLYITTDKLTPEQVVAQILTFLCEKSD